MIDGYLDLLQKYNVSLPRYTSYPTALELKPFEDYSQMMERYRLSILEAGDVPRISLYLHLPFCPKLCYFCACNKIISQDPKVKGDYLILLEKELGLLKGILPRYSKIMQIHLGGGSPSYLNCDEFIQLRNALSIFTFDEKCQKSIEIDPRTFSQEKLNTLYDSGYRRFSLGIQDFEPAVQALINRIQPYELVNNLVNLIRGKNKTTINFDLIYGLPGQTLTSFKRTINKVINLLPERIALYGYAQVGWKAKAQNTLKKYVTPSVEDRLKLFITAQERLEDSGYVYIGLDHFALPNDELVQAQKENRLRRNFMGYTTVDGDILLASGCSAISDLGGYLFQNTLDLDNYEKLIHSNKLPIIKFLKRSNEDKLRAFIIESLMCNRSISLSQIRSNCQWLEISEDVFNRGLNCLKIYESDGLVERNATEINITKLGTYFTRNIASVFDTYLHNTLNQQKSFSNAI